MLDEDRPSTLPVVVQIPLPMGNRGPINGAMTDTTVVEEHPLQPEHNQEQLQQEQEQAQKATNQQQHDNYTAEMSDQIPLMASLFSLGNQAVPANPLANANSNTMDKTKDAEHNKNSMEIYSSPNEYLPHVTPYHQWLCDAYFNYLAVYSESSRISDISGRTRTAQNDDDGGWSGNNKSRWTVATPTTNPFVSSSSSSSPLSRQEPSSSSPVAAAAADGSIDLTSASTIYHRLGGESRRTGHPNRSKKGIRIVMDGEGRADTAITSSGVESKGVSGAGGEQANEERPLSSAMRRKREMNIIPAAPAAAMWRADSESSSTTLPEVASAELQEDDPQSYWLKSPNILLDYLESLGGDSNKRKPPIGIERVYYYVFGPVKEPPPSDAEYFGVVTENDGNVSASATSTLTDFEQAFGVSEEHMEWLCATWRGNNTRVAVASSGGNNKDGINSSRHGSSGGGSARTARST